MADSAAQEIRLLALDQASKKYKVYLLTFPNGKCYCGFTGRPLSRRFNNGRGYEKCPLVWKAIQKYGWENVKKEIIFSSDNKNIALEKEKETIKKMQLQNTDYGYNLDQGGKPTEAAAHLTKEGRKRLSEKSKERWADPEYRKKIMKKMKNNRPTDEARKKGVLASAEARRGKPAKNRRPVIQIDLEFEKDIAHFSSLTEASLAVTGKKDGCTNILKVCKKKRKKAYGYGWRFEDE